MTTQPQHPSHNLDQKKGSADLYATGEQRGAPGERIAAGEGLPAPDAGEREDPTPDGVPSARASAAAGEDEGNESAGDVIGEQPGCGPSVTDYPGLGQSRN